MTSPVGEATVAEGRPSREIKARLAVSQQSRAFLILFAALYLAATFYLAATRPLWHDELFTFHVAGQGTPARIWAALRAGIDPNPPLIYVTTYLSQSLFGSGQLATRLPAILGFSLLLVSVYRFATLRLAAPFALQATIFVALTGAYSYAYEARAYGLLLGFAGLTLSCWQRRQVGAVGTALSLALLTHCYSVLILPPLFAGELVRCYYSRKIDRTMWLALILPCGFILAYFPLLRSTQQVLLAGPIFDPTLLKVIGSYFDLAWPALLAMLATLALIGGTSFRRVRSNETFEAHEWTALGVLALAPVMAFAVSSLMGGGYFTRYCLITCIPLAIGIAWMSHAVAGPNWRHARILPMLALACFVGSVLWEIRLIPTLSPAVDFNAWLPPGAEPLVIADGQTFLELDHHLDSTMATRLVFLTDRDLARRYLGTDCFDGALRIVRPWFPLRGKLIPYGDFIAWRKPFLVYGKVDPAQSWIWQRLKDEGISSQVRSVKNGMQLAAVTP